MIYLAFSGAKSKGWPDNEYIGFGLGFLALEGKNHFSATRFVFVS